MAKSILKKEKEGDKQAERERERGKKERKLGRQRKEERYSLPHDNDGISAPLMARLMLRQISKYYLAHYL